MDLEDMDRALFFIVLVRNWLKLAICRRQLGDRQTLISRL